MFKSNCALGFLLLAFLCTGPGVSVVDGFHAKHFNSFDASQSILPSTESATTTAKNAVSTFRGSSVMNGIPSRRARLMSFLCSSSTDKDEVENTKVEEAPAAAENKGPRHDVRNDGMAQDMDPEEAKIQQAFMEHQQNAPKLGWATDIRTLVQYNHGFAVMSTNSKSFPGYPGGSVIGFAPDDDGRPMFVFSGMSTHTQDLLADPRCSVTIASKEFKGAADGRVNLMGQCKLMEKSEVEAAKAMYLKKHPGAFWVNFGDFNWFRMEIESIRFVGGFARAGSVTPVEYKEAKPDPVSEYGNAIASHMNDDHQSATIAMVAQQVPGLDVSEAIITSVDSLGMYVKVTRTPRASDQPQQFKLRLPFPRAAEGRGDVKTLIVEMTQGAASASEEKADS